MGTKDIPDDIDTPEGEANTPSPMIREDRVNGFVAALTGGANQQPSPTKHPIEIEYEYTEALGLSFDQLFEKVHQNIGDTGLLGKEVTISISVRSVEEMKKIMKFLVQTLLYSDRKSFYDANITLDLLIKDALVVGGILEEDIEEHLAMLIQDGRLKLEEINFYFCRDSKVNPDERYVEDEDIVGGTLQILGGKCFFYAVSSTGYLKVSPI